MVIPHGLHRLNYTGSGSTLLENGGGFWWRRITSQRPTAVVGYCRFRMQGSTPTVSTPQKSQPIGESQNTPSSAANNTTNNILKTNFVHEIYSNLLYLPIHQPFRGKGETKFRLDV